MIGLPKTTPTPSVIFCCGALYPSIRIKTKELIYLHKLLQKEDDHWTKVTLYDLRDRNIGWAKQIIGIINSWGLEEIWDSIRSKTPNAWKKDVQQAAEKMKKEKILGD